MACDTAARTVNTANFSDARANLPPRRGANENRLDAYSRHADSRYAAFADGNDSGRSLNSQPLAAARGDLEAIQLNRRQHSRSTLLGVAALTHSPIRERAHSK
jgi:hypothetical protein